MFRKNVLSILLLVVGIMCFLALRAYTLSPTPAIPDGKVLLEAVQPTLRYSSIPLRLPTYIPNIGQRNTSAGYQLPPIRANVPQPQPEQSYLVILGYSPDCEGENACRFGSISGRIKPSESIEYEFQQILNDQNQSTFQEHRSEEPLSRVKLANGIEGWFLPWVCRNICTDAQVVWDEGIYRYSVSIKLGDKESLVRMANSAIQAGDR